MDDKTKEIIFANLRHAVAGAAVGTSMWGYSVTGSDAQMIGGGAVFVASVIWSILQKKGYMP